MITWPHETISELATVSGDTCKVYSYASTVSYIIKRQAVEHAGMPSSACKHKKSCVFFRKCAANLQPAVMIRNAYIEHKVMFGIRTEMPEKILHRLRISAEICVLMAYGFLKFESLYIIPPTCYLEYVPLQKLPQLASIRRFGAQRSRPSCGDIRARLQPLR